MFFKQEKSSGEALQKPGSRHTADLSCLSWGRDRGVGGNELYVTTGLKLQGQVPQELLATDFGNSLIVALGALTYWQDAMNRIPLPTSGALPQGLGYLLYVGRDIFEFYLLLWELLFAADADTDEQEGDI